MEKGLLDKTGKSLGDWIGIVRKQALAKHADIIKYLKAEHGFTHGYANFVALKAREADAASFSDDDLLSAQYKSKEALFPIYERILATVKSFGDDIEIAPKKANVSLRTAKQFALVQPSTKTRIDLGLKLKGFENQGRLESSGPFGSMCTHRVKLSTVEDVDDEVIGYIKAAYEASK